MIQDSDKQETAPKFWKMLINPFRFKKGPNQYSFHMAAIHSWKHKRAGDFWAKYDVVSHPVPPLPNIKCVRHSVLVSTQQRGPTTNLTMSPLLIFYCSSGEPKPLVGREGIFARLMKNLIFGDTGVTFMTIWWPFLTIWWQFLTILRQFLTILWQWYAQVPLPRWSTSDHATPH